MSVTGAHVDVGAVLAQPRYVIGCCFPHAMCDVHRAGQFEQLRGVVACRGEVWADEIAARAPKLRLEPWPSGSEKVIAIARTKVADLSRDPQLLEQLATELARWAERRWSTAVTDQRHLTARQ